jgi:hypothetical protein
VTVAEQRAPRYTWSPGASRYRDAASGRFVALAAVEAAMDVQAADHAASMRGLTEQLRDGRISLPQWQQGMAQEIKAAHVNGAQLAKGGRQQMTQSDYGFVGQRVREQLQYLRGFAGQIEGGKQPLDGRALRRAEMYGEAGRSTHREMQRRMGVQRGQRFERNVLGAADHCAGCLEQTRRGVVPLGALVPVGQRDCRTRCKCRIETLAEQPRRRGRAA